VSSSSPTPEAIETFRWLVEEYRVSLFAQELGTAEPVSPVKLDRALAELSQPPAGKAATVAAAAPPAAAPYRPMTSTPEKKAAPLKNLSALDRLFPK
jgi:ATP-dependent helicase HrpA